MSEVTWKHHTATEVMLQLLTTDHLPARRLGPDEPCHHLVVGQGEEEPHHRPAQQPYTYHAGVGYQAVI